MEKLLAPPNQRPGDHFSIQTPAHGDAAARQDIQSPPVPCAPSAAGMALSLTPVMCSQSVWLILLSLNAIGPFSSDAYLPNLPDIQKDLSTSASLASLTIQINWIVLGLINPVIGGLSDSYGRRTITVVSVCVTVFCVCECLRARTRSG